MGEYFYIKMSIATKHVITHTKIENLDVPKWETGKMMFQLQMEYYMVTKNTILWEGSRFKVVYILKIPFSLCVCVSLCVCYTHIKTMLFICQEVNIGRQKEFEGFVLFYLPPPKLGNKQGE